MGFKMANSELTNRFFEKWSDKMAYVLGYFVADGDLSVNRRGSHYFGFTSTDYELLEKIKNLMGLTQRIGIKKRDNRNWKQAYRIQIGSRKNSDDIRQLIYKKKKNGVLLRNVPKLYLRHFIRGFFDGDGNVSFGRYGYPKGKRYVLITRFAAENKEFLEALFDLLCKSVPLNGGSIYKNNGGYHLNYSIKDSLKLFRYMYENVPRRGYLERKHNIFQKAVKHWGP